jgi:hypothetical protein
VSDKDGEVDPNDFGDAIIEEFHVRTIERKMADLPFSLEVNVCLPQPEVTAHLGVPGHSWGVWKNATPYSGMMQYIWEKPKKVASQPLLVRELLRWVKMLEGQADLSIEPRNPDRLRIRKEPEPRGLYTRATFQALLDELSEGKFNEVLAFAFRKKVAYAMHRPHNPIRQDQLARHPIISDVKCPSCDRDVTAVVFTQHMLRDAKNRL